MKLGHITEDKLGHVSEQALRDVSDRPGLNIKIDTAVLKLITADMAKKYMIMLSIMIGATLTVVMADPSNVFAVDDIKFMTGITLRLL